jgi:heme exporter protein A
MRAMDTVQRLQVKSLRCIRQQQLLFADLSFQLCSGDVLLIEGANGSGKSSLLRLLTGLASPTEGDIFWHDVDIQKDLAEYWQHLHYIGHTNGIKAGLTVLENLQLASQLTQISSLANSGPLLTQLQLSRHQHTLAKFLSAGQKRRLALAKLFLFPKTLWILDEPLTALDTNTQALFLSRLEDHLQHGGIAIVSSHHHISFKNTAVKTLRLETC